MSSLENAVAVDDDTYESVVGRDPLVALYFRADWAGPCRAQDAVVDDLADTYPGLTVAELDVDENEAAVEAYDVESVPTVVLFEEGDPVEALVGRVPASTLAETVEEYV